MSHEITDSDGMVLTGRPAWHGLGTVVADAPTPEKALQIARLDWDVQQTPVFTRRSRPVADDNGVRQETTEIKIETHVANVRSDNDAILGIVGEGYSVVQNRDLAGLVREAAQSEGVKIESAGSLRGGKDVFFLAHLDSFKIGERDKTHTYALFANGHDGGRALTILPTSVRVVCANTLRLATSEQSKRLTVTARHSSGLAERMDQIRATLRGAAALASHEKERAEALAARSMSPDETAAFFRKCWERMYGPLPKTTETRGEKTRLSRARSIVPKWGQTVREEADALGLQPSAWLAANAVTRWIDRERTVRGTKDRTYTNLLGNAADDKADVFAEAVALLK